MKTLLLLIGIAVGGVTGWIVGTSNMQREVDEAKKYQGDLAQENMRLTSRNSTVEMRIEALKGRSYDRQRINGCITEANILNSAVDHYMQGNMLGSLEKGMLSMKMGAALVATQGLSLQSRRGALIEEMVKVTNECLDGAKVQLSIDDPAR